MSETEDKARQLFYERFPKKFGTNEIIAQDHAIIELLIKAIHIGQRERDVKKIDRGRRVECPKCKDDIVLPVIRQVEVACSNCGEDFLWEDLMEREP